MPTLIAARRSRSRLAEPLSWPVPCSPRAQFDTGEVIVTVCGYLFVEKEYPKQAELPVAIVDNIETYALAIAANLRKFHSLNSAAFTGDNGNALAQLMNT
jgi:hypothetical protein